MADTLESGGAGRAHPSTAGDTTRSAGGSPFTRQIGPLPLWGWMAVVLLLALVYTVSRRNKATTAAAAGSGTAAAGTQTASNTPPFIIQNYPGGGDQTTGRRGPTTGGQPTNQTPTKPYVIQANQDKAGNWDSNAIGLATRVYGLINPTIQDATLGASQIVAANPQINWSQPVPPGTSVNIPERFIAPEFKSSSTLYNQGS